MKLCEIEALKAGIKHPDNALLDGITPACICSNILKGA